MFFMRYVKPLDFLGCGLVLFCLLQLAACNSMTGQQYGTNGTPGPYADAGSVADAVPKSEPLNKYANKNYTMHGKHYRVLASAKGYDKVGYASWYGKKFHGRKTTSDERYNMYAMTAASPTLPIPSYVRVTNMANNKSVTVRINDRGPFKSTRIIDLSYAAAKKLGYTGQGTALVRVTGIDTNAKAVKLASNDTASTLQLPTPQTTTKAASKKPTTLAANSKKSTPPSSSKKPALAANTKKAAVTADKKKTALAANKPVYLQVGVYTNREKADSVSKKIAALTKTPVKIKPGYHNNKRVYRVHVGPVLATQYDKVRQALAKNGFEQPLTVTS